MRGLENFKSSGPLIGPAAQPAPAGAHHLSPTGQPGCGWFPGARRNWVLVSSPRALRRGVCLFVCVINGKQGRAAHP